MLKMMNEKGHHYERPSWRCRGCGDPWPCADARAELTEKYDEQDPSVVLFLSSALFEALNDHVVRSIPVPEDLHHRILGWIRR